MEEMNEVVQEIGKAMYAQQQQAQPNSEAQANPETAEEPKKDEPVEAEFEDVKKE